MINKVNMFEEKIKYVLVLHIVQF